MRSPVPSQVPHQMVFEIPDLSGVSKNPAERIDFTLGNISFPPFSMQSMSANRNLSITILLVLTVMLGGGAATLLLLKAKKSTEIQGPGQPRSISNNGIADPEDRGDDRRGDNRRRDYEKKEFFRSLRGQHYDGTDFETGDSEMSPTPEGVEEFVGADHIERSSVRSDPIAPASTKDLVEGVIPTVGIPCEAEDHPSKGHVVAEARDADKPVECGICFESETENPDSGPFVRTICAHDFHQGCLDRWLDTRNYFWVRNEGFPLCRTNLIQEQRSAAALSRNAVESD
jgi:hypothetical protein